MPQSRITTFFSKHLLPVCPVAPPGFFWLVLLCLWVSLYPCFLYCDYAGLRPALLP